MSTNKMDNAFQAGVGSEYQIIDVVGEGAYGVVWSVLYRATSCGGSELILDFDVIALRFIQVRSLKSPSRYVSEFE